MSDSNLPCFEAFDWSVKPADPNDRLLGALISNKADDGAECGAIMFGLPFDGAVLGRKGCAAGPRALRAAAKTLKTSYLATSGGGEFGFAELKTRALDLGDAVLPNEVNQAHTIAENIARYAKALADVKPGQEQPRVIALGGDHSLTYPCALPYLDEHGEDFVMINLDAHLDIRRVKPGEAPNSGTSFRRLLDKGLKHYIAVGVREWQTSPVYVKEMHDAGGKLIAANEVLARGVGSVCERILGKLPKDCHIYLSVDLDVADASVAPGVSAPTPGGLLAHHVTELVRTLCADSRVCACGILELAPNLEAPNSDRTARLGAALLAQMLVDA